MAYLSKGERKRWKQKEGERRSLEQKGISFIFCQVASNCVCLAATSEARERRNLLQEGGFKIFILSINYD